MTIITCVESDACSIWSWLRKIMMLMAGMMMCSTGTRECQQGSMNEGWLMMVIEGDEDCWMLLGVCWSLLSWLLWMLVDDEIEEDEGEGYWEKIMERREFVVVEREMVRVERERDMGEKRDGENEACPLWNGDDGLYSEGVMLWWGCWCMVEAQSITLSLSQLVARLLHAFMC